MRKEYLNELFRVTPTLKQREVKLYDLNDPDIKQFNVGFLRTKHDLSPKAAMRLSDVLSMHYGLIQTHYNHDHISAKLGARLMACLSRLGNEGYKVENSTCRRYKYCVLCRSWRTIYMASRIKELEWSSVTIKPKEGQGPDTPRVHTPPRDSLIRITDYSVIHGRLSPIGLYFRKGSAGSPRFAVDPKDLIRKVMGWSYWVMSQHMEEYVRLAHNKQMITTASTYKLFG